MVKNVHFELGEEPPTHKIEKLKLKFMTEVSSIMAKICNINFCIENEPHPPPLGTFPKIHPFRMCQASLREAII